MSEGIHQQPSNLNEQNTAAPVIVVEEVHGGPTPIQNKANSSIEIVEILDEASDSDTKPSIQLSSSPMAVVSNMIRNGMIDPQNTSSLMSLQQMQHQQVRYDSPQNISLLQQSKVNFPQPQHQLSYKPTQVQSYQPSSNPLADISLKINVPFYETFPYGHIPNWGNILPQNYQRVFHLKLLSTSEFQITEELPLYNSLHTKPLVGLKKILKKITKGYGTAIFDQEEKEPRFKIPIACYHQFYTWLSNTGGKVEGIPAEDLKFIASSKEQLERQAPKVEDLLELGVPSKLAEKLAPYQRRGVVFIHERQGKALLADEMGLGKTVQSIASASVFRDDWPLLVICPSGARFHWEHEILYWLGSKSELYNKSGSSAVISLPQPGNIMEPARKKKKIDRLLSSAQVHVVNSFSEPASFLRQKLVLICAYGIVTKFIEKGVLSTDMFNCVIVDESHHIKNPKSKRATTLKPFLKQIKRCILLSGTPSFAKPTELLTQLDILGAAVGDFKQKYCSKKSHFGLHAYLTSTVMIRRLKNDILKDLPVKEREIAQIHIKDPGFKRAWERLKEQYATNKRGPFLFALYRMTGKAKVPIIIKNLEEFLFDPTSGKLCIFANHMDVLDDIERSGLFVGVRKAIRIDGRINPIVRKKLIHDFQTDPTVRVALLGINAASVCISLTASSKVWFAELFWTPSIMLQAEDRCHRIGQRAKVLCTYFYAKGTIDDIIWKLIRTKYSNLGEYLEGKTTSFFVKDGAVKKEDFDSDENEINCVPGIVKSEIIQEATKFQEQELAELNANQDPEEDAEDMDIKSNNSCNSSETGNAAGMSESVAICLSDTDKEEDDDEEEGADVMKSFFAQEYPQMKIYKMRFSGKTFGLIMVPFKGRIVVHQRNFIRENFSKPYVGDILVGINGYPIPYAAPYNDVVIDLRIKLNQNIAVLWFAEDAVFSRHYKESYRFDYVSHEHSCLADKYVSRNVRQDQTITSSKRQKGPQAAATPPRSNISTQSETNNILVSALSQRNVFATTHFPLNSERKNSTAVIDLIDSDDE